MMYRPFLPAKTVEQLKTENENARILSRRAEEDRRERETRRPDEIKLRARQVLAEHAVQKAFAAGLIVCSRGEYIEEEAVETEEVDEYRPGDVFIINCS